MSHLYPARKVGLFLRLLIARVNSMPLSLMAVIGWALTEARWGRYYMRKSKIMLDNADACR